MLDRVEEIQGIGLLHAANGKPYPWKKATLIYADNGRGKSTLATVLRSVSLGDGSLIVQRKTIDGTLPPKAILQFNSGHKVTFAGNAWSEKRPEVLVFDADFVERNVHSGGAVSTGHRKNLLEFALGEVAVAARAAVDKATSEAKTASEAVQGIEVQLIGYHAGLTLAQFEKLAKVSDPDAQVAALQKRIVAAGNVAAIIAKVVPAAGALPTFDMPGLFEGLAISLENVHAAAEQVVKQHILKLGSKNAESWLNQGQQFGDDEECPYCGQGTPNNDLIRAYQTHFNEAYSALKVKVAALSRTVDVGIGAGIIDVFARNLEVVKAQAAAWAEQIQTQPIEFDDASARTTLTALQALMHDLVRRKQASPAESCGSASDLEATTRLWGRVVAPMTHANSQINAAAGLISTYKGQLAGENVPQLSQQVQQLQATKQRHEAVVVDLFGKRALAKTTAAAANAMKTAERQTLDGLMTGTLQKYEKSINALLKNFGASFSIIGMGANFRGGAPRSEYGLSIRGKDVSLEGGPPSFSTTLSEGDKRTLAFAFFVASTLADPKLASRIVIVDDPMCSLDLNRRHHTRAVLKALHKKADQLVVLAHDPYFIRDLRDALLKDDSAAPMSVFQLCNAVGDYTSFGDLNVDQECESPFSRRHRLLTEFASGAPTNSRLVAEAIRTMLEGYLHRRFPGLLPKAGMFGQVVILIRDAIPPSPLCHAQNLVDLLNEINDYAGQFHHDTNPDAEKVAIVSGELKTFVEKALFVVHGGIPKT